MDDLAGFGKAAERFFALVESSIGTLYRPRAIRTEGKASAEVEAYKVIAIANANAKANIISADNQGELERRAIARLRQQELTKQTNIESIVQSAAERIKDRKINEEADKDWLNYFFDECSNVSNKDVQQLWAKVLARQVTSKRRLSRKLIDCLRWLDSDLAKDFIKLAPRVFYFDGFFAEEIVLEKSEFVSFSFERQARALAEIGLLRENLSKTFQFSFQSLEVECSELSDRPLDLREFFEFTSAGRELALTVCEPIIRFERKLQRNKELRVNSSHYSGDPYTSEKSKIDSVLFGVDKRSELAASHIANFLVEIAASVVIRKSVLLKGNLFSSRPIMTITKNTPSRLVVKRESKGAYVRQLHDSERRFLDTIELIIETNRRTICNVE